MPQIGDGNRPGREFYLAEMGMRILRNSEASVLLFGGGHSRDFQLVAKTLKPSRVAVSDVDNFPGAPDFVPLDSDQRFDIVVARESISTFSHFPTDFGRLFAKRAESGLVIAETNIADGRPIERMVYPFEPGRVAYHTGSSLYAVAQRFGFEIDFRLPESALRKEGPRRRCVFFGGPQEMGLVSLYFAAHAFASSGVKLPKRGQHRWCFRRP